MNEKTTPYTDMSLIAALLSYGFETVETNRDNPQRQQFFFLNEEKEAHVFTDSEIILKKVSLDQFENMYMAKRLLLLPNYPDILKSVKYKIHSYRDD